MKNITCATDDEIAKKIKYIEFMIKEGSEKVDFEKRNTKPIYQIAKNFNSFYLNIENGNMVDVFLERNEIHSYENRFLKFDWDFV